ncbi:LysE family translocator [Nocardia yamanashiensis]|uniref:LysE family translocator n=1 Tax=Nocardia yamanashiensis TaxID=209247 RepID=UPI001E383BC1|nr:LysE family translocator [Nocardia yamanashiensis]UGT43205.1 LysE family translocator [Nocardia yamanashiensis]
MGLPESLISFAVVAALLTVVPGVDTALVLRAAVSRGRRYAFATAIGVGSGTLVWGAAAAAGVSTLVTASEVGYAVLRVVGAIYLVWMGVGMIRAGLRRRGMDAGAVEEESPPGSVFGAWVRGLGTNLLNPKVGVFYVAMLPQFLPEGAPPLLMGCLLAVVHNVEGMVWFAMIISVVGLAKSWLSRDAVRRGMDLVTGTVMVGFGVKVAASHR